MTIDELRCNNWVDESGHYWNDPRSDEFIIFDPNEVIKGKKYLLPWWFYGGTETIYYSYGLVDYLKEVGRSAEEYVARFLLNLPEVPKCPTCGNQLTLRNYRISSGFKEYCNKQCAFAEGSEHNLRLSESQRRIHSDPNSIYYSSEYRKLMSESVSRSHSRPEVRAKISEGLYRSWSDPNSTFNSEDYKIRHRQSTIDMYNADGGYLRKMRSELFSDPKVIAERCRVSIINKPYYEYYSLYIGWTQSGNVKIGVIKDGGIEWRLKLSKLYRDNDLLTLHNLFFCDNVTAADFEYDLKEKFNYSEYIPSDRLHQVFSVIRELLSLNKFKVRKNKELRSTTISEESTLK